MHKSIQHAFSSLPRDHAPVAFFHSRETGIKIFAPGNSREFPGNSKFTYYVHKLYSKAIKNLGCNQNNSINNLFSKKRHTRSTKHLKSAFNFAAEIIRRFLMSSNLVNVLMSKPSKAIILLIFSSS